MDHVNLNELPPFDRENPSAENIAVHFAKELKKRWHDKSVRVASVTVWETPDCAARYIP